MAAGQFGRRASSGKGVSRGFRRHHALQRACPEPLSAAGLAAASAAPGGNSCSRLPCQQLAAPFWGPEAPVRPTLRPWMPRSAGGSPSERRHTAGGSGGSTTSGRVRAAAAA